MRTRSSTQPPHCDRSGGAPARVPAGRRALALACGLLLLGPGLSCSDSPDVQPGSVLLVELAGEYVEAQDASPLQRLLLGQQQQPFVQLLFTLGKARRDERIESVVLRIRGLELGWGKAQEIRGAIERLREAGKEVVAYLEVESFSTNLEYYVATAADRIYLAEGATTPLVGLAAQYLFLGGMWEKLGIDFEVGKAGRYKSAVESITGREMSEASREMAIDLLDSMERQFVAGIGEGRDLEAPKVRDLIDQGLVLPAELEGAGLVDGTRHLDALVDELGGPLVKPGEYARVELDVEAVATFALIYGSGNVVSSSPGAELGGEPAFAADRFEDAISKAVEDEEIDAVVLRIDSPGGSSLAAERMWRATRRARSSGKPVIASFSDVAASGGYYVAAAADAIVSPPGALTGSIGVFALKPRIGGLYEKLGIHTESFTRGRYADFYLPTESSEGARERLQSLAIDTYELFLARVAEGRDLSMAEVDEVAQGRVWSGSSAYAHGLVDELGGLLEAVDTAQRMLELDPESDVYLVPYPPAPSLVQQIGDLLFGNSALGAPLEGPLRRELAELLPLPAPLSAIARAWLRDGGTAGGTWLLPEVWVEVR